MRLQRRVHRLLADPREMLADHSIPTHLDKNLRQIMATPLGIVEKYFGPVLDAAGSSSHTKTLTSADSGIDARMHACHLRIPSMQSALHCMR